MESVLKGTAYTQHWRGREIHVAPVAKLCDPNYESALARFYKIGAPTATMACNRITFSVLGHHDDGGIIITAKGAVLDLERMEAQGEQFVYNTNGEIVRLYDELPLRRLEDSFGASPRRTMSRFLGKADRPSERCLDRRLLSMVFWSDASQKILDNP